MHDLILTLATGAEIIPAILAIGSAASGAAAAAGAFSKKPDTPDEPPTLAVEEDEADLEAIARRRRQFQGVTRQTLRNPDINTGLAIPS